MVIAQAQHSTDKPTASSASTGLTMMETTMTQPSSSKVALLENALNDLHIRSAVEETMQSMLMDVELAGTLSREVSHQYRVSQLEATLKQSCSAMQEQRAIQTEEATRRMELADDLVKELWTLSITLGDLEEWQREKMPILEEHDSLLARLTQAEEEISILREKKQQQPVETASSSSPPPPRVEEEKEEEQVVVPDNAEPVVAAGATTLEETVAEIPSPSITVDDTQEDTSRNPTTDAVVVLLEEEEPPNLSELDMEILNHIFGYLDAFEILRTAQCNISLYSRVDSLFGLGGGGGGGGDVTEEQVVQQPSSQPDASFNRNAATIVPIPASSTATQPKNAPKHATRQGGLFSMLQNRTTYTYPATAAAAAAPSTQAQQPVLNRSAVSSMADKLTPTELTAIISMTEKLNSREKEVKRLTDEKEELAGKLDGTERFKEFLSQRVLDLETSLRTSEEDQTKVTLQISSDQEVIAFLDGRVQELERNEREITEEKKKLVQTLEKVKDQNSQKVRVLSDMLQFERERLLENEKDWKATKKLLVKEVKNCRAQIMAVQAERDGYREQNERLKKAVLVNGGSRERMEFL